MAPRQTTKAEPQGRTALITAAAIVLLAVGIASDAFAKDVAGRFGVGLDNSLTAGDLVATRNVDIRPREAVREVEVMGQGSVNEVHTSDLWVYEGVDGRDYAVTGTWGGDGWAKFWDVTDPANITQISPALLVRVYFTNRRMLS
mgnify:CR=1 FL=1